MKILLYNDTYRHIGGAETYCLELLPKLKELGHDVRWMAHGTDAPTEDEHIVLPDFNAGKINYFYSKYFFNKQAYKAIRTQLEEWKPDVVHLHHNRFYTFSMHKALKDTGTPAVATIHDYTMLCPSQYYPDLYYDTPGKKSRKEHCQLICSEGSCLPRHIRMGHPFAHDRKRKKVTQQLKTFIAPSLKLKEYLERAGFSTVHFIPFFVEEEKWSKPLKRTCKNTLLFVGRVETNKGIYLLIDVVKKLRESISDIRLIIAGGGTQVGPIQEKIEVEGLSDFIESVGFIPYELVSNFYNKANVVVVPSLDMEQFGLVGIEGLASGAAVIGSDTGGIPEWCVHEETGLLFDAFQEGALEDAIRRMLCEEGLAEVLTKNGMKHIQTVYNEQQHFEKLISVYQSAKVIV